MTAFPDPTCIHPVTLPNGQVHKGTVFLKPALDHPRFQVGDFTYCSDFDPPDDPRDFAGRLAPYLSERSAERLIIGKYCQIAHGVRFITSSANHAMHEGSTFPFPIFDPDRIAGYQPDRRDTAIGHDCWFGMGAMICPGAQIGNGVIIGAGAVVRGTIPDYSIVTGNRAQVVRRRFAPAVITALSEIEWWHWPAERAWRLQGAITRGDTAALRQ